MVRPERRRALREALDDLVRYRRDLDRVWGALLDDLNDLEEFQRWLLATADDEPPEPQDR